MSPRAAVTLLDHMDRREAGAGDRWIVFKLPAMNPERWAASPRGPGVWAQLYPVKRRWVTFPSLTAAGDYARGRVKQHNQNPDQEPPR